MGECVSQGITLGGTIFKHPGTDKILSHILLNTTTWASWSPLYWWQLVHVMPAIASSSSCSHFSGHPASKPFNTGRDRCPKLQGEKAPLPRATCHLKPVSSGSAEVVPVSITIGKFTVLCLQHTWSVVTTKLNLPAFPRLSAHSLAFQSSTPGPTDSFFNCNWQSFCSSPCFQSWEPSKISRKNHDYFFLRSRTGNRLQEKSS